MGEDGDFPGEGQAFPKHPALESFTGFLLRKVSKDAFDRFSAAIGAYGLHPMHFGMLTILDAEGPISQQELGRRTGVDPSTMVARMDVLEEQGLVERGRNADDRRAYEIVVTPKGRRTLAKLREEGRAHGERIFGVLDAEERAQFHALLAKLSANIDAQHAAEAETEAQSSQRTRRKNA